MIGVYMNKKKAKRSVKKNLLGVLSLLLAVLLCACTPTGNDPDSSSREEGTTAPLPGTVGEHILGYTIIYPDAGSAATREAATAIYNALGKGAGRTKSDFVLKAENIPHNNNEILIGNTNRASSQAAMEALRSDSEYSISFFEGEVVIAARTDEVLDEAVRYFTEQLLSAPAANCPNGFVYTGRYEYPLSEFFGLSLTGLKIAYSVQNEDDSKLLNEAALRLQTYLRKNGNAAAEIVPSGEGNIRLVVDSSLGSDDYAVETAPGAVILRGGCAMAIGEVVSAIEKNGLGQGTAPFTGKSDIPFSIKDLRDGSIMNLVWHDEFEGDELDPSKWQLYDRMWGNSQLQTSTDRRTISLQNGEVMMNTLKNGTGYLTNKSLTTWDRMSFQYGYLEIRAKIPNKRGAFPSFWLQSAYQHRADPNVMTEVDVLELYRSGYIEGTMHKWYLDSPRGTALEHDWNKPTSYTFPADQAETLSDDYHLYGFGWTPTEIYFTVDGIVFAVYDITDAGDFGNGPGVANPNIGRLTGMQCFQDPMVIIFNNWIHTAENPGYISSSWIVSSNSDFPYTYTIDWVRLYQKPGLGALYYDEAVPVVFANTASELPVLATVCALEAPVSKCERQLSCNSKPRYIKNKYGNTKCIGVQSGEK